MSHICRFLLILLLAFPAAASAQTFPPLSGRVVDAAGLLNPAQVAELTAQSEQIQQASSRQFVVATIPDLQGYPIEDYGYKLGRAWKIGQSEANNGIILIVAPKEKRVRIEVGYGLEPIMTDALSSIIINQTILPKFKAGDMAGGIVAGAGQIAEQMKLPPEAAEARAAKVAQDTPKARRRGGSNGATAIIWIVVLLFFVVPMIFRRAGGRRYHGDGIGGTVGNVLLWSAISSLSNGRDSGGGWGGGGGSDWGGGGGGGFSGGGGSFGGGGASGGW